MIRTTELLGELFDNLRKNGLGDPSFHRLFTDDPEFRMQVIQDPEFHQIIIEGFGDPRVGYIFTMIQEDEFLAKTFLKEASTLEHILKELNQKNRPVSKFLLNCMRHKQVVEELIQNPEFRVFIFANPNNRIAMNVWNYDDSSLYLLSMDRGLRTFLDSLEKEDKFDSLEKLLGSRHQLTAGYLLTNRTFLQFYDENRIDIEKYKNGVIDKLMQFHLRHKN